MEETFFKIHPAKAIPYIILIRLTVGTILTLKGVTKNIELPARITVQETAKANAKIYGS